MTDKPMTPERLEYYRKEAEADGDISILLAEIDRLRSPPDEGEVVAACAWLKKLGALLPMEAQALSAAADLLTRLSASLSAMRERAEKAEAAAQAEVMASGRAVVKMNVDALKNRIIASERQRVEALEALEKARADALSDVARMREALEKIAIGVSPSASMEVTDKVSNVTDHYNNSRVSIRDFARSALKPAKP